MKFIPYGHQSIDENDINMIVKVLKSDWLTQGPMVEKFERAVADYCGAKYAVAVSNGTAALHIACLAAGIKKGDEVITSPITFVASANCVLYCGGKPVFADIQEDIPNIDPDDIKKNITKKTKAIKTSSKNISAVCGLAIYSKKNKFGGTSSIENLVKPCKEPLEPLPSTVPDIS